MSALPTRIIETPQCLALTLVVVQVPDEPVVVQALDRRSAFAANAATGMAATGHPLIEQARAAGWNICDLPGPSGAMYLADAHNVACRVALVLLTGAACRDLRTVCALRETFAHAIFVSEQDAREIDLVLPRKLTAAAVDKLLTHAAGQRSRSERLRNLIREAGDSRRRMHQLTDIGNALTSSRDLDGLLETILSEARHLARCDGASLYLLDREVDEPGAAGSLMFKLAQNDSIEIAFTETRLPLTAESIAGYVALYGRELNLDDAYALDDDAPYHFNDSFDQRMGYRTQSMLVLPMRDHRDRVVGVLQFINCIDSQTGAVTTFNEETVDLLRAISSQAAVSIQKNLLIADMNGLFESFVQASVKTIERRDPGTSGHSFRVAEHTLALLTALPQSGFARFQDLTFSPSHLKEVRYAALLHDFGKIGVRESVLVKARKLTDARLDIVEHRIALQRERARRRALEEQLDLLHRGEDARRALVQITAALETEMQRLDQFWEWIQRANQPSVLDAGEYDHLAALRSYPFEELDGSIGSLLAQEDVLALSVRRGSLTPEERIEIESHVSHTREFLDMLQWPEELASVPGIAGAHHEKLNGSGYPKGLVGDQIPLASRVMTVCDIYDALTAMDRPYKSAIAADDALRILEQEAVLDLLDPDIVRVFIDSGVYLRTLSFN